jgi:hypothetical protein
MNTKIIAFAGRKQSGKTTCSEFLSTFYSNAFNASAKIYNFADPLKKDICMNILGLTYDQCYGSDEHKNELTNNYWDGQQLTAREVMQMVGTDMFRKMQQNVWADATLLKIKSEQPDLAIIADCRFPNEVEAVKNAGGIVIKLNRNPHNSNHASETALDPSNYNPQNFNMVIFNEHLSIDDQHYTILKFLKQKGILPL